uniref:Transposase n=1 Tax=Steinernema glaseri TaxID=37863 RepID=A0A1I7YII7_9BILA
MFLSREQLSKPKDRLQYLNRDLLLTVLFFARNPFTNPNGYDLTARLLLMLNGRLAAQEVLRSLSTAAKVTEHVRQEPCPNKKKESTKRASKSTPRQAPKSSNTAKVTLRLR